MTRGAVRLPDGGLCACVCVCACVRVCVCAGGQDAQRLGAGALLLHLSLALGHQARTRPVDRAAPLLSSGEERNRRPCRASKAARDGRPAGEGGGGTGGIRRRRGESAAETKGERGTARQGERGRQGEASGRAEREAGRSLAGRASGDSDVLSDPSYGLRWISSRRFRFPSLSSESPIGATTLCFRFLRLST